MTIYEVTFNKDLPINKRNNFIPLSWPINLKLLKKREEASAGANILTFDEVEKIKSENWLEYQKLQQDYQTFILNDRLRVLDLVHEDFKNWHPSKIDFTMHLAEGIHLEKRDVTMTKNGRPEKAVYYYNNLSVAEIVFEFEADFQNFMTRRVEKLGYYSNDGHVHTHWIISDERFSRDIPYQHQKRLRERVEARGWIVESFMADIDSFTFAAAMQNPAAAGVLSAAINAIMTEYSPHIDTFIKTGGTYLRDRIQNDTNHTILNTFVAPGVTMRAYIVDKLTY